MASLLERSRRLAGPYAAELRRRIDRRRAAAQLAARRVAGPSIDRIVVAPTDLRSGDSYIADEIYAGRFPLAGRVQTTEGESPFEATMPSPEFERQLHAFRWLRHLRAARHELAASNARALTEDWIRGFGRRAEGVAWDVDIVARRLIAWFSHSPVVLRDADPAFYRRFLRSLVQQAGYLRQVAASAPDGEIRLRARIALAFASLVVPSSRKAMETAARQLDAELLRQIMPDGGHVSRSPQAILDLLTDLLPLRQTYLNLGAGPPAQLVPAIDRMYPALRFFRHVDGELALFNGTGITVAERLAAVLRYDDTSGAPFRHMPHLKFQRLVAGETTIIADTGPPPSPGLSASAHAGCLSFEMSSGQTRLIVNAGMPLLQREEFAGFARSTAAHSTAVLNNTSSSRISRSRFLEPLMIGGVRDVMAKTEDGADGSRGFSATHDGYVEEYGLYHERRMRVAADGHTVVGRDRFHRRDGLPPEPSQAVEATVRFHLHPAVGVAVDTNGDLELVAPDGSRWTFLCLDVVPEIQDDIFFANLAGPCRSRQIALTFRPGETPEIQWSLTRR